MTITAQDAPLTLVPAAAPDTYCVFEHLMSTKAGAPPEVVYVGACKLVDVYRLREARNNSYWSALTSAGAPVLVRIIATTDDRREAHEHAVKHVRSFPQAPMCNLHGYNLFGSQRAIICSNGQSYRSQIEAAQALGVSQSAISQHLKGNLASVKGYTFAYGDKTI